MKLINVNRTILPVLPGSGFGFIELGLMFAIFFVVLSYFFTVGPYWNITPDSCIYVLGGKNLHETGRYEINGTPLTTAPFVFSAMIAAVFSLFGESYFALNLFMKILILSYLIASFFLLKEWGLSGTWSLFVTLLTASSVHLIRESSRILADIPYALFSVLAVIFFNSYIKKKDNSSFCAAVVFIVLSYFTKTVGVALICASSIYLFADFVKSKGDVRRRKRNLFLAAVSLFAVLAVAWEARNMLTGERYLHYPRAFLEKEPWIPVYASPGEILKRTYSNFVPCKLAPLFAVFGNCAAKESFLNSHHVILTCLYGVLSGLFLSGVVFDAVRRNGFRGMYVVFFLIIFGVMNMYGGKTRHLLPIAPFIFAYPVVFLKEVFRLRKIKIERSAVFKTIACIYLVFYMFHVPSKFDALIRKNHRPLFPGSFIKWRNADEQELALWLKKNTETSAVCLSEKHLIDGLISERLFHDYPYTGDQERLLKYIGKKGISYILVDNTYDKVRRFLIPVISDHAGLFEIVAAKKGASLYRVKKNALVDHYPVL